MTTPEKIQAKRDDLFQRKGIFHIGADALRNHPLAVMALLSKVLVTHARQPYLDGGIEVLGLLA